MQVSDGDTFEDVCPLLDLKDGITNYTQHVRIASNLQLTTRNLPDNVRVRNNIIFSINILFEVLLVGDWIQLHMSY